MIEAVGTRTPVASGCARIVESTHPSTALVRDLTDRAVLAGIVEHRSDALWELYRRYSGAMHFLAFESTNDQALAQEVIADTFFALWRSPSGFSGESALQQSFALPSRLLDVVYCESVKVRRSATNESGHETTAPFARLTPVALRGMSREQRDALVLVLADYTQDDAAAVLDISTGEMRASLEIALDQLQRVR